MQRLLWIVTGFAGALALFVASMYWVTILPDGTKSVSARAQGAWSTDVSYKPGQTEVRIGLRLEGFSGHKNAEIKAVSSEPWAPTWDFAIERNMSEFLGLGNGYSTAPEPMTQAVAERVARSYIVTVTLDGEERTIDFSKAQMTVSLVLPTFDLLRFRLQR